MVVSDSSAELYSQGVAYREGTSKNQRTGTTKRAGRGYLANVSDVRRIAVMFVRKS